MKRKVGFICLILVLFMAIPASMACVVFCLPPQYGSTYYAVLPRMFRRLEETEGKRIIVVGNSAVAFGLEADLLEQEIKDYSVCPFGLYGAIGTKAMMDLSREKIRAGDIVILAPEQTAQSMSLYFSSQYVWNAIDGNFGLLRYLKNTDEMIGGFFGFASRKFDYYWNNTAPDPNGVYAASSFDENCKMIYDRPYNKLPLGYDEMSKISYDAEIISAEFAEYVNEYNAFIAERGATLLYGFAPVNAAGLEPGTTERDIDAFYDYLNGLLDCRILGSPHDYVFESDWFYDSNVHMNTAGAVVYTEQLVRDLRVYFDDNSPVGIVLPEKPTAPDEGPVGEDGQDAALFEYEADAAGWRITALSAAGKRAACVHIPDYYQGKKVLSFDASVFAGSTVIEEIFLGRNVYAIADGSFSGCSSLKRLYPAETAEPSDCSVYWALLEGAPDCRIYVPKSRISDYANDYFWSRYSAYLVRY